MIGFFRKIRKKLADDNKPIKYARYAVGEIVLVVIGILIALSINNWNQSNQEAKEITNYFQRIHLEFEKSIEQIEVRKRELDTLLIRNNRSLYLVNLKNKDSLAKLKETLGVLGTAVNSNLSFPMFEEFINQGFLAKIKNDSIKLRMQSLSRDMEISDRIDGYINNQYHTSIEPFFYKHINYSEVVDKRAELTSGGPETNYEQFYNNLELWNLLSFKSESFIAHRNILTRILDLLKTLDANIVDELNNETNN